MMCGDCFEDGKQASVVFDAKFMGMVCPRCERIYSPGHPKDDKQYVTKEAAMRRMTRDEKERKISAGSTLALCKRIMRED